MTVLVVLLVVSDGTLVITIFCIASGNRGLQMRTKVFIKVTYSNKRLD